ncbi:hypothetical protein FS837_010057 [Tulasnella sp. UAMH 9824]|nr:hypothetical protein FS837_010057 [Tulasnella sp. UAMH 9824]
MGLQAKGRPLPWPEAKNYFGHIREHGLIQLVNIWNKYKSRRDDIFLWGEEIECMLIAFDDNDRNAKLALDQDEVLPQLESYVDVHGGESRTVPSFQPEYGRHQIESTPGSPYNGSLSDLAKVEENMRTRRDLIRQHTVTKNIHHIPSTVATYPRIGVSSDFTDPVQEPTARDGSILFPEAGLASMHPRYLAVADGIKSRRGGPPCVNIPIFRDFNTMHPFEDPMAYPKYREFNDEALPYDEQVHNRLVGAGMDEILAKHFASLYVHDPVVVFEDRLHQDDETSNEHFENTENMSRAQKRDAVREQKFWFSCGVHKEGGIEEMTLDEIVNGKASFIHKYLDSLPGEDDSALERQTIEKYLELIKRKANGSVKTTATWIRDFVRSHPEYKQDSVVTQTINYDLLKAVDEIERGVRKADDLLAKL